MNTCLFSSRHEISRGKVVIAVDAGPGGPTTLNNWDVSLCSRAPLRSVEIHDQALDEKKMSHDLFRVIQD